MAENNIINNPRSAFYASLGTQDVDVTGDATVYQLGQGNALTVAFDLAGEISTAGVFTAAHTGVYSFSAQITFEDIINTMTSGSINFTVSTGAVYESNLVNPYAASDAASVYSFAIDRIISLTAGDTVIVNAVISNGTKDADTYITNNACRFSGFLSI